VVGRAATQGSLCGHTLEKCPNCKRNHIGFSNRCAKETEAAKAARQSRGIRPAVHASANAAAGVASGTNRVTLGHRHKRTAKEEGRSEAELVDVEEEEAKGEAEDIMMTESVTTAKTETGTETETAALATTD